ncbi:MAG: tetratricopeptide repeat protein [Fuerstiella sp.]|nr:tetratricopeptide repeat protein [Fuerstiella sp.]
MAFSFLPEGGWPVGKHEVVLVINDEEAARRSFSVSEQSPDAPRPARKTANHDAATSRRRMSDTKPTDTIGDPKTAAEFNSRGVQHYDAGRYDEAQADFSKALKLQPRNAEYMCNRGWVFYEQDDPDTALLEFNDAIELDPTLISGYHGRAAVHIDEEDWAAAIMDYTHAVRHTAEKTELADVYTERGNAHYFNGDTDKAIKDLERAISKDPEYARAHADRGEILSEIGETDEAVRSLRRAIEIDAESAEFHNLLGNAYEESDDSESAISAFSDAILLDLNSVTYYQNRARVYAAIGDLSRAVKDLKRAITLDPDDPDSHNNLALVYGDAGEFDAALRTLDAALALDGENPILWYNRGDIQLQIGDLKGAVSALTRSIDLDDQDPDAYALRGKALQQDGNEQAAARDYAKAVSLAPDFYRMAKHKYLRISNKTGENLRVWVQYFTDDWQPDDAREKGAAAVFEFAPDEEEALTYNKAMIHGSRFRIWATGLESKREYFEYRESDYVVVADAGYITSSEEIEFATFSFMPTGNMTQTPSNPAPGLSPDPKPDSGDPTEEGLPRSRTIHAVAYGENEGKAIGVCFPVRITVDKNPSKSVETAFTLSQAGDTWRAAGWQR